MTKFKDYLDEITVTGDIATNTAGISGIDNTTKKKNKNKLKKALEESSSLKGWDKEIKDLFKRDKSIKFTTPLKGTPYKIGSTWKGKKDKRVYTVVGWVSSPVFVIGTDKKGLLIGYIDSTGNKHVMKQGIKEFTYLKEATILGGSGQAGDDDTPPGNIIMGLKFKEKKETNRLTGTIINHVVDNDPFTWDKIENTTGMEDPNRYDDTIVKSWHNRKKKYELDDTIPDFISRFHKHVKHRNIPDATIAKKDTNTQKKYWGTIAFTGNPRPFLKYVDEQANIDEDRKIHINISDDRAGKLLQTLQDVYKERGIQVTHDFVDGVLTLPDHLYDEIKERLSNNHWIDIVTDET